MKQVCTYIYITFSKRKVPFYFVVSGLDTACITRTVVQKICSRWEQDITQDVTMTSVTDITSEDLQKIKSIGWLVFDETQRLDLLIESNTLIRAFLGRVLTMCIFCCVAGNLNHQI